MGLGVPGSGISLSFTFAMIPLLVWSSFVCTIVSDSNLITIILPAY